MENNILSLQFLESLSSAELISLADDYGIDIPDNLNRRFIIGELLEVAQEQKNESSEMNEENIEDSRVNDELPSGFNETQISVVLRNPAWAYVFWDISEAGVKQIEESSRFSKLVLRILYFENEEDTQPLDYYDINVSLDTRAQYVLLENNRKFFRVDLVAIFNDGGSDNVTVSRKIKLPEYPEILKKAKPGSDFEIPEILEASGLRKLLKIHYEKYRESFSE